MQSSTVAMALAGILNLLLAVGWMAVSVLGANGFHAQRGSWFLGGVALVLLLAWAGGLLLARKLTLWGQVRGWASALSLALASAVAVAAFLLVVAIATFAMAVAATNHSAKRPSAPMDGRAAEHPNTLLKK